MTGAEVPGNEGPGAGVPGAEGANAGLPTGGMRSLAAERRVVVCCGSGGVGKTTVSATFALEAARLGRRACVVTVDPARRLADALGVDSLPNTPTTVDGDWPGQLDALMLDTKGTFDDLIERYARDVEQAASIRSNRLYQNLAGALSGTQEYMAMEKLYELTADGHYDLVVVDTPPTRNALDLLDAPRRLTHFLENRLFRALLVPTRAYFRAVTIATQALLRTISKVAGAEIVQDAVTFFQAFEGMEEGFRERAIGREGAAGRPGDGLRRRDLAPARRRRRVDLLHRQAHRVRRGHGRAGGEPPPPRIPGPRTGGSPGHPTAATWPPWKRTWPACAPSSSRSRRRSPAWWRRCPRPRWAASRCSTPTSTTWAACRWWPINSSGYRVPARSDNLPNVQTILVASDAPTVRREVIAVTQSPEREIVEITSGPELVKMIQDETPDLVIVDLQMGNMGGMAVCLELRLEESYTDMDHVPVLMLLDRRPDVFLARRSGAEGWLVKPLDPLRLRRAVAALLDGGVYHDDAYQPVPVLVAEPATLTPGV